jgi:hypothetical protein
MHSEQARQGDAAAYKPAEPHPRQYIVDDCCGMMFFSDKPPAPMPPREQEQEGKAAH